MFGFSGDVVIEDEFLRDGLQNEARLLALADKLAFVRGLEEAGVRRIQLGSFVNPARVPQMADTDALFAAIERRPGVTYTALVLNMAGLERALAAGVPHLSISVSASESHSRANVGKSVDEAIGHIAPVIERALGAGVVLRAGIQSAFGCGFEGKVAPERVVAIARTFDGLGVHEINLADTAGLGNPRQVFALTGAVRAAVRPHVGLSLHLHDTRGLGLANMVAGLQAACASSTPRSAGWAAARSSPPPPATSPPRTPSSRSRRWAFRPASTGRRSPGCRDGWATSSGAGCRGAWPMSR